jgi:hypothetical protein
MTAISGMRKRRNSDIFPRSLTRASLPWRVVELGDPTGSICPRLIVKAVLVILSANTEENNVEIYAIKMKKNTRMTWEREKIQK